MEIANISINDVQPEKQNDLKNNTSDLENADQPTVSTGSAISETEIEKRIKADFDSWSVWRYQENFRTHLGASSIGEDCLQRLWFEFRWVKSVVREGRMYRLLNRGHREEPQIFEMLRGIGFQVWDTDPNTGKQYRFRSVAGHYAGSLDAIAIAPERYGFGDKPMLVSVKTCGTGSAFTKFDDPMQIAQPNYWAQENAYGHGYGFEWALWLVVNKNDDDIAVRFQKLDPKLGAQLEHKAQKVIFSCEPLSKISKSPAFKACQLCNYKDVCHKGAQIAKNCRSCKFAHPSTEAASDGSGQWFCKKNNAIIPTDFIANGCELWAPIYTGD